MEQLPQSPYRECVPTFADVALLIIPFNPPRRLEVYFKSWAPSLRLDRGVSERQPTKAVMNKRMAEIENAAGLLRKWLRDDPTREFLEGAGSTRFENRGGLELAFQQIVRGAGIARAFYSTPTGETKAGRGKAIPPNALSPKAFCAILVVEAWAHFRGSYWPLSTHP